MKILYLKCSIEQFQNMSTIKEVFSSKLTIYDIQILYVQTNIISQQYICKYSIEIFNIFCAYTVISRTFLEFYLEFMVLYIVVII